FKPISSVFGAWLLIFLTHEVGNTGMVCHLLQTLLAEGLTAQCAVQPNARMNCGYPYISAQECNNRGCCFDDSIDGVIWCFFPSSPTEEGNRSICLFFMVPEYAENIAGL
uniref:P-type domain-containing protein n=1 Tax=Pelusios castaneus TaxID=367368 RepID=A0A8C8SFW1_9SAUR